MKTKEFNDLLGNVPFREVSSGTKKGIELYCGNYIVVLDIDCDIDIKHFMKQTYTNPEEYSIVVTKEILDLKVYSDDYGVEYFLNGMQEHRLVQEIKENLSVVY